MFQKKKNCLPHSRFYIFYSIYPSFRGGEKHLSGQTKNITNIKDTEREDIEFEIN
jgi:hypothetical protein